MVNTHETSVIGSPRISTGILLALRVLHRLGACDGRAAIDQRRSARDKGGIIRS